MLSSSSSAEMRNMVCTPVGTTILLPNTQAGMHCPYTISYSMSELMPRSAASASSTSSPITAASASSTSSPITAASASSTSKLMKPEEWYNPNSLCVYCNGHLTKGLKHHESCCSEWPKQCSLCLNYYPARCLKTHQDICQNELFQEFQYIYCDKLDRLTDPELRGVTFRNPLMITGILEDRIRAGTLVFTFYQFEAYVPCGKCRFCNSEVFNWNEHKADCDEWPLRCKKCSGYYPRRFKHGHDVVCNKDKFQLYQYVQNKDDKAINKRPGQIIEFIDGFTNIALKPYNICTDQWYCDL